MRLSRANRDSSVHGNRSGSICNTCCESAPIWTPLAPAAVEGEPVGFISQAAVKMLKAGNAVCIAGKADEYFFVPVYTATQVAALTAQCEGLTRWKRGDKVKWKSADGNTNRGYIVSANSVRINIGNGYIHSVDPVEWGLEHDTEAANRGVV
jgi:hypothetical protein